MSEPLSGTHPGAARIDRWLFAVRLFKSRTLAAQAVAGGRVHVNGERVRAARELRAGDRVSFVRDTVDLPGDRESVHAAANWLGGDRSVNPEWIWQKLNVSVSGL